MNSLPTAARELSLDSRSSGWTYSVLPQLSVSTEAQQRIQRDDLNGEVCLVQMETILGSAVAAAKSIIHLCSLNHLQTEALLEEENPQRRIYWAGQIDVLLEQMIDIARQSGVEGANLLYVEEESWSVPSISTKISDEEGFHYVKMSGLSLKMVKEQDDCIGLLMLTGNDSEPVAWVESLKFTNEQRFQSKEDWLAASCALRGFMARMEDMLSHFISDVEIYRDLLIETFGVRSAV
ncbi:MAG: hypothetical protein MI748_08775 [Opitutales bacterium]|nr:hypothetical protein [Opitutales bacterium]